MRTQRYHMGLRLAVNGYRVEMENSGHLASSERPVVGAKNLGDQPRV